MNLPLLEASKHRLASSEFGTTSQLLAELGRGNDPIAVLLTCSELGFAPDQLSRANPGEIIIVQSAGALISPPDVGDAYFASIIQGLMLPSVRHLVVCGHTNCGPLRLSLVEETAHNRNPFERLVEGVTRRFHATYSKRPARDWLGIMVQEAALQQVANLRSHDYIQSRLQQSRLYLHAWIRHDKSSAITAYNPTAGQFCD